MVEDPNLDKKRGRERFLKNAENRLVDLDHKIDKKQGSLSAQNARKLKPKPQPLWTSTVQSMAFLTVEGIQSETSIQQPKWPIFSVKELSDNSYDFLNDHYPVPPADKNSRKIGVRVEIDGVQGSKWKERVVLRIAVQNSNINNIPVFDNLSAIFDFTRWHSTKRHQYRMTCGSLGDFLKRILGMGYASWVASDDDTRYSFEDNQWPEPVILRFNEKEYKIFLVVDTDNSEYHAEIKGPAKSDAKDYTEVEIALPLDSTKNIDWRIKVDQTLSGIQQYFEDYKLAKTDTEFSFSSE